MSNSTGQCKSRFQGKLRAEVWIRSPYAGIEPRFASQGSKDPMKTVTRSTRRGGAAVTMDVRLCRERFPAELSGESRLREFCVCRLS